MCLLFELSKFWFLLEEINCLLKGYLCLMFILEKVWKSVVKSNLNVVKLFDFVINLYLKNLFVNFEVFWEKFNGNIVFLVEIEGRCEILFDLFVLFKFKFK